MTHFSFAFFVYYPIGGNEHEFLATQNANKWKVSGEIGEWVLRVGGVQGFGVRLGGLWLGRWVFRGRVQAGGDQGGA